MIDDPETFEGLESFNWSEMHPETHDNFRTRQSREREQIDRLYAKYCEGGASPKLTYLQICAKYCDVDWGYSFVGDE